MAMTDMTMMYLVHDALRRDVAQVARLSAGPGDRSRLAGAAGWDLFSRFLHVHHTAEDDVLWPMLQTALADRPDDLAIIEALEAEHAAIDPLVAAIERTLRDPEARGDLGDLVDALATELHEHLRHEERSGLPLMAATLTDEQAFTFSQANGRRIGDDAPRYFPWILDGARYDDRAHALGRLPDALRQSYEDGWKQAYETLELWPA